MKQKLDEIINYINEHHEWNKITKMRYAYIKLGELVHKDVDFFFSLYGKLGELNLNIEELQQKMDDIEFKNNVTCKTSAEMLKYIFDNVGIESKIIKTCESYDYVEINENIKQVTYINDLPYIEVNGENIPIDSSKEILHIYHFMLLATGDDNKKYFLVLNPDLSAIQNGFKTKHFGIKIPYYKDDLQYYEGEEVEASTIDDEELKSIDEAIGYVNTVADDKKQYIDEIIERALKLLYARDEHYLYLLSISADNLFYKTITCLLNDNKDDYSHLCFNIKRKSLSDWSKVKKTICFEIINKIAIDYEIELEINFVRDIFKLLEDEEYEKCLDMFLDKLRELNIGCIEEGIFSFESIFSNAKKLINIIENITNEASTVNEIKKAKKAFLKYLEKVSLFFVDRRFVPTSKMFITKNQDFIPTSEYIANRLILSFNEIFNIGSKDDFNKLNFGEQSVIIDMMLELIFANMKVDKSASDYDDTKSAIGNRVISCGIVSKDTHEYNYLFYIKDDNGGIVILYDLKNNILHGGKTNYKTVYDLYYFPTRDTINLLDNTKFIDDILFNREDLSLLELLENNIITTGRISLDIEDNEEKVEDKKTRGSYS